MIKVLTAALVGTIIGIVVMVAVIAISGTDTSGASSVGLGDLSLSTAASTVGSTQTSVPPASSGGGQSGGSSGGAPDGNATAGQALFTQRTCSSCHSAQSGTGSPNPAAPNLADLSASGSLTEDVILTQIQNGGAGMPPGLATGQDAKDLAAYILSLSK
ncbi:MAG TPA: cytochrome c [Gaiellales bacterium]|jgi:cytochrome c551